MTNLATRSRSELQRILLLGLLVLGIVLAAGLGALAFAAGSVDQAVAAEERALVVRTLDRRARQVLSDITSATVWDDAYINTVTRFDPAWIDENYGVYYSTYMHHDRTLVFGPDATVVYASDAGEVTTPDTVSRFAVDVSPIVSRVRRTQASRATNRAAPRNGLDSVVTASALIRSGGDIWMVGASSVTPETTEVAQSRGPGATVVSARRLDPGYAAELQNDLGISAAHLVKPGEPKPAVAVDLKDAGDRVLGVLAWSPKRPGMGMLGEVLGPVLLVLAAFGVAAWALSRRVFAVLRSLAENDRTLEATLADLTVARDRAEAASVAKSRFLANVSHEIRTPLNGVLGMAQIMDRGELAPAQRKNLAIIRESGATLLTLLNDVLDLAKIEAGKLDIQREETDVGAAVGGVCATFTAMAREKSLKLGFAVEPSATGVWLLDGMRLNQVMANLISNAIKFTASGHVSVRVWKSDRGLEFAVMDTGAGIPVERLNELFGKFNQIDSSTTRQFGGTGLGLAICRELVSLMGGEIAVESAVGEGSCFSFFLPAEAGRARTASAA
ncbi:MAG: histidine kinase [Caulobacterales bacterium]|nr:histidine kinase [Caulobacterales bacterium]